MLNNMTRHHIYRSTAYLLIAILVFLPRAEAALVAFDFESEGTDGSMAVGFVEWDDAVADNDHPNTSTLIGLTRFKWVISGGLNNGLAVMKLDLIGVTWSTLDNGLQGSFGFKALSNGQQFEVADEFIGRNENDGTLYAHRGFGRVDPVPSAIPIPAAILMFVPALVGLFGFSQRRKKNTFATLAN